MTRHNKSFPLSVENSCNAGFFTDQSLNCQWRTCFKSFTVFSFLIYQAIDAITKTTAPYLHTKESREDFQRKIKEAMRKPTQKKRKTRKEDWVVVPSDKPVAVPVGETRDVVATGEQGSLSDRIWDFLDTYCRIL